MPTPIGKKAPRCRGKTRSGHRCKNKAMRGKTKCRMHGGKSTGAKDRTKLEGNTSALKHGIYAKALREDEKEIWEHIDVDGLDDEIKLVKLQFARAQEQINKFEDEPPTEDTLPIVEVREDENDTTHITRVRRAPDLASLCQIRDRLVLRLSQLLRTKALLRSIGMGSTKTAEDFARDIRRDLEKMEELNSGGTV